VISRGLEQRIAVVLAPGARREDDRHVLPALANGIEETSRVFDRLVQAPAAAGVAVVRPAVGEVDHDQGGIRPEAEAILHQLRRHVLGTTIRSIWVGRTDIIRQGIELIPWYEGARIRDIKRYGKTLVFTCAQGQEHKFLLAELGMTGRFLFCGVPQKFDAHIHMILYLEIAQIV